MRHIPTPPKLLCKILFLSQTTRVTSPGNQLPASIPLIYYVTHFVDPIHRPYSQITNHFNHLSLSSPLICHLAYTNIAICPSFTRIANYTRLLSLPSLMSRPLANTFTAIHSPYKEVTNYSNPSSISHIWFVTSPTLTSRLVVRTHLFLTTPKR